MGRKNSKKKKDKQKRKHAHDSLLTGTLDISRSGTGFVVVDNMPVDVLIRPGDLGTALHGDKVKVKVKDAKEKNKRQRGVITEIVNRKQTEFVGTLQMNKGFAFFVADTNKKMPDIFIHSSKFNGARDRDRVVVKLLEWDDPEKRPEGEVIQVLDKENENDIAMKEILLQYGFPLGFPDDALEEAARISDIISAKEIKRRQDFRDILTFTIDPIDAKDFDDALSFRVLKNGNYEIGVHIADVTHYLDEGTALDKAAYEKATSVYLPDRVNPMLPEEISNVLCSLRPLEDKLTFSAVFQMTSKGKIKQHWLGKTIIHSDHRFTYEEVQEIIETKDGLYRDEILILNELAQQMRKERFRNGAINFSSQEVRFKLDENNKPIGIIIKESLEAHQLIEEFMLLANRTVAENLGKINFHDKPIPFPYRIHDDPDEEKLTPFIAFAKKFGHRFDISSPNAIAASFNQMLKDVHGKPEQHVLEQLGIRTMAKAKYTTENVGHYGLGFDHYCHFTSPIRRYPDVLVHRILDQALNNDIMIDKKLEEKCRHCSEKERAAMEAERAANKYKQVEYMQNFLGEEFEGVISGVASFGFWAETVEHKCEGLVSINSLSEYDDFRHIETDYCLVGARSGRTFRMGDKVWIKVIAANLTKRQLDYEWVVASGLKEEKTKKKKKNKPQSRQE
ncbi:MAG TPA: ribonuclease R [Chitinophagaceae bacterium]|nr:ribonuclease R [Chitinophagaceae bacterium]